MKSGGDELVVTGIGIVSPVGHDAQATMKALLRGESGIELLPQEQRHLTPVYLHAPVDAGGLASIGQREARRLDRSVQFALQAAREAWADAGRPDVEPIRLAAIVSTGMGGLRVQGA